MTRPPSSWKYTSSKTDLASHVTPRSTNTPFLKHALPSPSLAAGPSRITADHLSTFLDNEAYSWWRSLVWQQGSELDVEGLRLGRLTALQKPDGGVRGVVVGTLCTGWSQQEP